jgi:hypothetical protein
VWRGDRKVTEVVNVIKVYYMCVWKDHNQPPDCSVNFKSGEKQIFLALQLSCLRHLLENEKLTNTVA